MIYLAGRDISVKEVFTRLSTEKTIGLDTETTGLDPHTNEVIMLQVGTKEDQYIIDCRIPKYKNDITKYGTNVLQSLDITKVLINAKFDIKMIQTSFGITVRNVKDCMLHEQIITGGLMKASMAAMAEKYLGITLQKELALTFLTIGDGLFNEDQIIYGALDVLIPLMILDIQEVLLDHNAQRVCADLENKFTEVLSQIELAGMYLNSEDWLKIYVVNKRKVNWYKYTLAEELITLGKYSKYKDINWNSPKQVVELFKELKIPTKVIDKAKTLDKNDPVYKDTVGSLHLQQFKDDYPVVFKYLMYRKYHKASTTYGEKFLNHINPNTGRVHSNYFQIKRTGRLSSSKPNLQNIDSTSKFRQCFQPQEGNIFIVADYSSQESRVMADISGDKVLEDFFLNGDGDLHSFTARKMFRIRDNEAVPSEQRRVSKTLNFGIPYGMGGAKLAKQFDKTIEEGNQFIKQWLSAYKGLDKYFKNNFILALHRGYVLIDKHTGRRAYHPEIELFKSIEYKIQNNGAEKADWSNYYRIKSSIERMSKNYPIQGLSASITKLACILIYDQLANLPAEIVNTVHDEIIVECKLGYEHIVSKIVQEAMEQAGRTFCKTIPLPAQPKITKYWTH